MKDYLFSQLEARTANDIPANYWADEIDPSDAIDQLEAFADQGNTLDPELFECLMTVAGRLI